MSGAAGTIERRLFGLVVTLVALMVLAAGVSGISAYGAYRTQQTLAKVNAPAADANAALLQTLTDAETGLRGYEATHDATLLQPFQGAQRRADSQRAALSAALRPQRSQWATRLQAQDTAVAAWWRWANESRSRLAAGGRADLRAGKVLFDDVRHANGALGQKLQAQRLAARASATRRLWNTLLLLAGSTLLAAVVALYAGWRVTRSLTGAIGTLRTTVRAHRNGDRSLRADERRGPLELRELATDFNHLSDSNEQLEADRQETLRMQQMMLDLAARLRRDVTTRQALSITAELLGEATGTTVAVFSTHRDGDEQSWTLEACHPPAALDESRMVMVPPVSQESIARKAWLAGQLLEVDDLANDPLRSYPFVASITDQMPVGALLGTPLGVGDEVIGAMLLISPQPRQWVERERTMLQQATANATRAFLHAQFLDQQAEHVARLEALDQQKDDFVGTVSHELRTPLTSISGYLEMLDDGDFGDLTPPQRKALAVIGRNTVRLRGLIEDVLVLNRIDARKLDPSFRSVDLGARIRDVVQDLAPQATDSGVRLTAHAPSQPCIVDGDALQLDRALINVIGNAIKFTPADGAVTVTLQVEATRARVRVEDTGIGIPAEDLDQMFTRFFRAGNALSRTIPGTGLGLAIVQAIIEAHDGTIELHSIENSGTTVVLDLPLAG